MVLRLLFRKQLQDHLAALVVHVRFFGQEPFKQRKVLFVNEAFHGQTPSQGAQSLSVTDDCRDRAVME